MPMALAVGNFHKRCFLVNFRMQEALLEATLAQTAGDVPVGAIIVRDGEIIAKGHNEREQRNSPFGHAEMIALEKAAEAKGDWRLSDCDLYVTLEPCAMCAGAIIQSGIRRLYFGAWDPEAGACGGRVDLFRDLPRVKTEVYSGIMEEECTRMLKDFFQGLRKK